MSLLSASAVSSTIVSLPIVNYQHPRNIKLGAKCPAWLCTRALPSGRRGSISVSLKSRKQSALVVCSAALLRDARCGAEQTQTVTRESSTITVAPVDGKEMSPKLDDGGSGLPPGDDGGGGGGSWSGGFFLFGFLAFLAFLKDEEKEDPY